MYIFFRRLPAEVDQLRDVQKGRGQHVPRQVLRALRLQHQAGATNIFLIDSKARRNRFVFIFIPLSNMYVDNQTLGYRNSVNRTNCLDNNNSENLFGGQCCKTCFQLFVLCPIIRAQTYNLRITEENSVF